MYTATITILLLASSQSVAPQRVDTPQQPLALHPANVTRSLASPAFGYTGVRGPLGWAGLSSENFLCSNGSSQSPINLNGSIGSSEVNPRVWIPDGYGDFKNLGTTVEVPAVGTTIFMSKVYQLQQLHFHTPAEHRINEEFFPLEIHLVHQAADGAKLVLGAVFEITTNGATTELVSTLARQIHQIANPGSVTRVNNLRAGQIIDLFQNHRLYQYFGSLTTPPCTEAVTWLVAQTLLPLDVGSYLAFKRVVKFNARYTQNTPGMDNLIEVAVSQSCH